MARLVRCDRCGKEIKLYESKPITMKEKRRCLLHIGEHEFRRDLCNECYSKLEKWLKNEEAMMNE